MNLLRDVCTAVGAIVIAANVLLLFWVAARASCMFLGDWLAERRQVSGPDSPLGEVAASGPDRHPSLSHARSRDGSVGAARDASRQSGASQRPGLRAVPTHPTCRGGAA